MRAIGKSKAKAHGKLWLCLADAARPWAPLFRRAGMAVLGMLAACAGAQAEGLPRSLSCSFERGTTTTYGDGAFRSADAAAIVFKLQSIDLEGQSADLSTGQSSASAKVRIVRALNANHFLEAVNEGFLNLTTVYDRDPARDAWPAVHSRHFGVLGQPVVAQYHGFCKAPGG